MSTVRTASVGDLEVLVRFETALFAEDAAVHEEFADPTWPEREGDDDFRRLLASPDCLVLVAERNGSLVGHLVAYRSSSSPTRQPVEYAVLRSIYVLVGHRRSGVADALMNEYIEWAQRTGCVEAHVDSYAANLAAQELYERRGFSAQSISRVRRL